MLVAGGTSIGVLLKNRLIEPEVLVYLGHVPNLTAISEQPDGALRLGSMATLRDIARSPLAASEAPSLVAAAEKVGNPRVRAVATIGGAIVHGDPRQDVPPVMLALGAVVTVQGPRGTREIPMSEFLTGFMESAVEDDEIVLSVEVPSRRNRREAYTRFTPNSEDDYPTVGVAASLRISATGEVEDALIALGGVDSHAIAVAEAGSVLVGSRMEQSDIERAAQIASLIAEPSDDSRGSESYKRSMIEVCTRRTLVACLEQ